MRAPRLLIIGKFPPIQGGTSTAAYWAARTFADEGWEVDVLTNLADIEPEYEEVILPSESPVTGLVYSAIKGHVKVYSTNGLGKDSIIPSIEPSLTKLVGKALTLCAVKPPDLIIGWYFEPYGMAAAILSLETGIPFLLKHAGSDISRLFQQPDAQAAYKFMLEKAWRIVTSAKCRSVLAISDQVSGKLVNLSAPRLHRSFSRSNLKSSIKVYANTFERWAARFVHDSSLLSSLNLIKEEWNNANSIVFGMYGKVGKLKGSFYALESLARLAKKGCDFRFVYIASGNHRVLTDFYRRIAGFPELNCRTLLLPPIHPQCIPGVLRNFDATMFLEHDFPIEHHTPLVPREILATSSALLCSAEIANKVAFARSLVDTKNYFQIADVKDTVNLTQKLTQLIDNPDLVRIVGRHGKFLSDFIEKSLPERHPLVTFVDASLKRPKGTSMQLS